MSYDDEIEVMPLTRETSALINNGLDFLNKAREELQAGQAKFSVVSFWTAVEILMKVPLVHEHWTLACSGKKMERKKYLTGDFQSVTYDEACARLGDVLDKPLSKKVALLFNKVKNHRNRVVHFYHNELSDGGIQQVLTEQADAWFALNRLMREDWASLFGRQLCNKLAEDEGRMLRSSEFYAGAKFRDESVQNELAVERESGTTVSKCLVCGYDSLLKQMISPEIRLYDEQCLVCDEQNVFIDLSCPKCSTAIAVETGESGVNCNNCGHEFSSYEVFSSSPLYEQIQTSEIGCADCSRLNSVCIFPSMYASYLCMSCFYTHEQVYQCSCCGCWSTDEFIRKKNVGCMFCKPGRYVQKLEQDLAR